MRSTCEASGASRLPPLSFWLTASLNFLHPADTKRHRKCGKKCTSLRSCARSSTPTTPVTDSPGSANLTRSRPSTPRCASSPLLRLPSSKVRARIFPSHHALAVADFGYAGLVLENPGWQLGSEPEVQVATVVSNHLATGLMKYFGDAARYGPLINLFEKLVVKEGEVACLLAQSYLGMSTCLPFAFCANESLET
jgi:hypothetical protein